MTEIRVQAPLDKRSAYRYAAALGGLLGIAYYALLHPGSTTVIFGCFPLVSLAPFLAWLPLRLILLVTLTLPPSIAFARRCQRWRIAYWAGSTFGSAFVASFVIARACFDDRFFLPFDVSGLAIVGLVLAFILLAGVGFGAANVLVSAAYRRLVTCILEQDGTLCWSCGYIVGSSTSPSRCPECGHAAPTAPHPLATHLAKRMTFGKQVRRITGWALAAAGICIVGLAGWRFASRSVGTETLLQHGGTGAVPGGIPMLRVESRGGKLVMIGAWDGIGVAYPIAGDESKRLAVTYDDTPKPGQPAMQLLLLARGATESIPGEYGDPVVICNLPAAEASYVRANGVPPSLAQAMVNAADAAGWQPSTPIAGQFGSFIIVDPSTHFPPR